MASMMCICSGLVGLESGNVEEAVKHLLTEKQGGYSTVPYATDPNYLKNLLATYKSMDQYFK